MSSNCNSENLALSEPATGNYFVSAYPPFSCWTADETSGFRGALEEPVAGAAAFGLYVHIPFCVHRCPYCYYRAYDGRLQELPAYLAAVQRELALYGETPAIAGRPLSFVYFGGGTPSLLSVSQIQSFFAGLRETVPWDGVEEATFECAPRSVTETKLHALRNAGITRLSMGIQQLDDGVLEKNGRIHATSDVRRAYERVERAGFDVVNVDLMVGMIGETEESFWRSFESVLRWAPDSVTVYQLEIPPNTPLFRTLRDGSLEDAPPDWNVKRRRLARAFAELENRGYAVVTAYCAVRDPDKHRFVYQQEQYRGTDLLGVGVSSFSYLRGIHQQNLTRLGDYMGRLSEDRLPLGRAYALDPREQLVREFVLQLKLGSTDTAALRSRHGIDPIELFAAPLQAFRKAGWLKLDADRVYLTREGLLRADRMIPEFYLGPHRVARYS